MNHLINRHVIEESDLDQGNYFYSILKEASKNKLIENSRIEKIQLELAEFLGKMVERYTNGESSSIRVETAQQLLQSICYCIRYYLKSVTDMGKKIETIKKETILELYYHGVSIIDEDKIKSQEILENLQLERLEIDNYAYHDTLLFDIPDFLHDYDIEFAAHDCPDSVEYPLCNKVDYESGIEFIYEYLIRLQEENNFCKHFSNGTIEMLLGGYSTEYMHVLVNIYELVLTNALGAELLGQNISELNIDSAGRELLQSRLESLNYEELRMTLSKSYENVSITLGYDHSIVSDYTKKAIIKIAQRLYHNLKIRKLEPIFIQFEAEKKNASVYIDGTDMDDEMLRDIMDEMRDCRLVDDKIAILQRQIHSLNDLVELLQECFFDDEFKEIYKILNEIELAILWKRVEEEKEYQETRYHEPLKEWQQKFVSYIDTVEKEKLELIMKHK